MKMVSSRNEVNKCIDAVDKKFLGCCILFTSSGLNQIPATQSGTLAVGEWPRRRKTSILQFISARI